VKLTELSESNIKFPEKCTCNKLYIFKIVKFEKCKNVPKNSEKITAYSLINFKNFLLSKIFFKSSSFSNKKF